MEMRALGVASRANCFDQIVRHVFMTGICLSIMPLIRRIMLKPRERSITFLLEGEARSAFSALTGRDANGL